MSIRGFMIGIALLVFNLTHPTRWALARIDGYCGSECFAEMQGFCPTCRMTPVMPQKELPWGVPPPHYWQTGPLLFPQFYSPAPWNFPPPLAHPGPAFFTAPRPGVAHGIYPGRGDFYAAKPNLYVMGPLGTQVNVEIQFSSKDINWLAAVPVHGTQGWEVTLAQGDRVQVKNVSYDYLYSDYRAWSRALQDQAGFCSPKDSLLLRMAQEMKKADFTPREIAHFLEYWTVKLPKSDHFCVYPQDERQLDPIAPLKITPRPAVVRRLLFLVQVQEGITRTQDRFSKAPTQSWQPTDTKKTATPDPQAIVVHEWGVGFLAEKP